MKTPKNAVQLTVQWTWTPKRRQALRFALQGLSQADIARRVHVHRHTIAEWASRPAWIEELRRELDARHVSTKLRRIDATEKLTDKLGALASAALDSPKLNVSEAQLLLRENREYMRTEREHFGEGASPPPAINVNIGSHTGGPTALNRSFRGWVEENMHVLNVERVNAVANDAQAMVEIGIQLLQKTSLLDDLHEENVRRERGAIETA